VRTAHGWCSRASPSREELVPGRPGTDPGLFVQRANGRRSASVKRPCCSCAKLLSRSEFSWRWRAIADSVFRSSIYRAIRLFQAASSPVRSRPAGPLLAGPAPWRACRYASSSLPALGAQFLGLLLQAPPRGWWPRATCAMARAKWHPGRRVAASFARRTGRVLAHFEPGFCASMS